MFSMAGSNRITLRKYIRFQLAQMGAENEALLFEDLALELARARVATNVIRATGPVQAGGDQGRDFETYKTYLNGSAIAGNSFVANVSNNTLVFACTLNKRIVSKVKADLKTIFGGGVRPDRVFYFCEPDVPVALRHKLQDHCQKEYNSKLDLFDGLAISDMLSDGDTFWIAEHYLSVPSEMFPPVKVDAEYQSLKERWLDDTERNPINLAEFLEVKRGLRRATFEEDAKPDLNGWMRIMLLVKQIPHLERKAIYELAVASLRGRGVLDFEKHELNKYFDTLPVDPKLDDIEDFVCITSYISTAFVTGELLNSGKSVEKWGQKASKILENALKKTGSQSRKYRLLKLHGQNLLNEFFHKGSMDAALSALLLWSEAADIANVDPFSDPTGLGDTLLLLAPMLGTLAEYQALTDKIDAITAAREGAAAAGELARNRAIAFAESGQILLAIDQLQRAKENWFNAETLRGSVISMLLLSSWYIRLRLPHAARYHAAMALFTIVKANDTVMGDLSVQCGFTLADTFYLNGEMLSFLTCVENIIPVHANYRIDSDDVSKHIDIAKAMSYGIILLATIPVVAPDITSRANRIIDRWNVDEAYLTAMREGAKAMPWSEMTHQDMVLKFQNELGQDIVNDVRQNVSLKWSALGITWKVVASKRLRVAADALAAMLQIVQVDLGQVDLVIIPSNIEIHLDVGGTRWESRQEPDNGKLLWTLFLPDHEEHMSDEARVESDAHLGLKFIFQVLRQISALPNEALFKVLDERMQKGLWKKVFFVRPPEHLMSEARAMADFEREDGPIKISELRPNYEPLAAPELNGVIGNAVIYSTAKAEEMISNRYRKLGPFASRVAPILMGNLRTKQILKDLHDKGFKDWELINLLFSIAINRVAPINPREINKFGFEAIRKQQANSVENLLNGTGPSFCAEWLNEVELPFHIRANIGPIANSWGLEVQRQTPDLDAIKILLIDRFRHLEDDVEHQNWFGWQ